jgi:trimethylamine--corrinoid protein Co-methyltransferase
MIGKLLQESEVAMRPRLRFLTDALIEQIVAEAIDVLCRLGVKIHHRETLSLLADHGAAVSLEDQHARLTEGMIREAIRSAPSSFRLYDSGGKETHHLAGDAVHFTPGSAALYVLDYPSGQRRRPSTGDYVDHVKVVSQLAHIAAQATAMIPADVPTEISDSYRLFLSLIYCAKPVVTGAFSAGSFEVMKDLQVIVRGTQQALREKPLTIFSCCPTSPLQWGENIAQNLLDCSRCSIPVEFIAMPLAGFLAPVTLTGTLIQHTAETLSGVVISQLANSGTPILYGGSPAIFDVRHETTPMGAVETMMIDCAYAEIGKHLGLPTQAYISLSDSKLLDAQAGLESGVGAMLGALAGINSVSGPGMLEFENCQSLEKLVLDNEICGMALRLIEGIESKEDFPACGLLEELLRERHLLIADHTLRYLKEEIFFPGPVIERARRERWQEKGSLTLPERAHGEATRLLESYSPPPLAVDTARELTQRMEREAIRFGQAHLPAR